MQTSASVTAGKDAKASEYNKVVADLAEIYSSAPGVPIGGVIYFWSNNTVPINYQVADGSVVNDAASPLNGLTLPQLISRFIRGTSQSNLRSAAVFGGEDTHTLNVSEMPAHGHSGSGSTGGAGAHSHTIHQSNRSGSGLFNETVPSGYANNNNAGDTYPGAVSTVGDHAHSVTVAVGNTGGDGAHNNIPAYVGLLPIIRIK